LVNVDDEGWVPAFVRSNGLVVGNLFVSDVLESSMLLNRQNSSRKFLFLAQDRRLEGGQSMSALPGYFRNRLFRYCQGVIDLNAEIPDRAFDLGMSEQELDGPEISQIRKCEQCIEKVLSQEERDRPSGSLSIKMK
jgi:hypothetical protein